MNVLVTGGAGFVGSHIADAVLAAGHRVVIIDNLRTGRTENLPAGATFHPIDIVEGDAIDAIYAHEQIDAVIHQAALANVRESMSHPVEYAKVNLIGTLNLLEAARHHGCKRFLFASTGGAVYGEGGDDQGRPDPAKLPFSESSEALPKDHYGVSKLSAEFHFNVYRQSYGLDIVVLRYANVYGPRQSNLGEAGVISIFVEAMLNDQPTKITGDGNQMRDFVFVTDVASINLLALESNVSDVFNVGTGRPSTINQVHELLSETTRYTQEANYVPRPPGEVVSTYLDISKAEKILGWTPAVQLEEGLQQTTDWFRARAQSTG